MTDKNLTIKLDYTNPATIKTLKETVAKGATDAEFAMFAGIAQSTGLNPFKREIWFIKTQNGQVQMMTGVNGYYAIANSHPQFDGLEVETIEESGKLVKVIAKAYRKDRSRPTVAEAYFSEYAKQYGNWKTMPRLMLSKCAESLALRKAFPQELGGLYTKEEMPAEYQENGAGEPRFELVETKPVEAKVEVPKPILQSFPGSTVEESEDQNKSHYFALDKAKKPEAAQRLMMQLGLTYIVQHDAYMGYKTHPKLKNLEISAYEFNNRTPPKAQREGKAAVVGADAEFDAQRDILDSSGVYDSQKEPKFEAEELQHLQRNQ